MNKVFLICGGIILIGIFIFLFLVFKARKKHKAIKHYESIRDSLTLREQKEKEEELDYENYSGFNLGNLVGGLMVLFVGVTILPLVKDEVASASANLTGSSETMLGLVTIFFILGLVAVAIAMVAIPLRKRGLL